MGLWAQRDLNPRPTDYESAALTKLSYGPESRRIRCRGRMCSRRACATDCKCVSIPVLLTLTVDPGDVPIHAFVIHQNPGS